jgi:signal transduction histidine kinase
MLAVLAYFIYLEIFAAPYIGFNFNPSSSTIIEVHLPHPSVVVGDKLVAVGPVEMAVWQQHLRMQLFPPLQPGDTLNLLVLHESETVTVDWVVPERIDAEVYARLINIWPLGLAFWVAGAATLLLVRPRDSRYWLFATFFLLTAFWLVVGNTNRWGHGESRVLFRMAIWLAIPVLLHVHWDFPQPLAHLPRWVLWMGYAIGVLMAALQWVEWVPPDLYTAAFAVVLMICLVLLVLHFVRQPYARRAVGLFLVGFLAAFVPLIGLSLLTMYGFGNEYTAAALLFLPAMPGTYFYVVFRHRLGGAELRANRLVTIYLFMALLALVTTLILVVVGLPLTSPGASILVNIGIAATAAVAVFVVYPPFARWVERSLLAMPLPPEDLVATYIARISTSLTQGSLAALLSREVLPSLLIRQSALFTVHGYQLELLYADGIASTGDAPAALLTRLTEGQVYQVPPGENDPAVPWVRVGLPLRFDGKIIGLWLLGRRDPDDIYGQPEILMLQSLAAQTAIALVNIQHSATLQALYTSNVIRHEAERRQLAHQLHDEILHRMAILYNNLAAEAVTATVEHDYAQLKSDVRQMIAGLRPPMLDYGLPAAFDALVEDLDRRADDSFHIALEVIGGEVRHPIEVEEQIFRIVQQACENTLAHAQAGTLRIAGEITAAQIHLRVEDDGIGFDVMHRFSLSQLLADKHYGLVGMHERAESIGAVLAFTSALHQGTVMHVTWRALPVARIG